MALPRPPSEEPRQVSIEGILGDPVEDDRQETRSPSFVGNSKLDLKIDGSHNSNSNLWIRNPLMKPQGSLVIKEPSPAGQKVFKNVEGKGKSVMVDSLGDVTPRGEKDLSTFDPEASSSGLKIFVNRFGNSNAIPGHSMINANSCNLVNKDIQTLDVGKGTLGASHLSDVLPKLDNGSGNVKTWSTKPYIKLNFKEGEVVLSDDGKAVRLNEVLEMTNSKKLSNSLVIKVFGKDLPSHVVAWEIRRQWRNFGHFHFTSLGKGWFLCSFNSEVMMEVALSGGPWFVNGHIVGMERWSTDFSSSSLRGLTSPIWIRLPHLPLQCWDEENVARVASRIGEPLLLDGNMFHCGRREFARVCVRVKFDEPLPL
ncbi:hypothetical protein M5K25_021088 [Dendrobium thyrsiflorum]|uniref:DUF4283 domain-containing protein n=1 Tax=Dendrobium thyrsiflorum TaxID=117978 RepID=A0ABD0UCD3_DENTH